VKSHLINSTAKSTQRPRCRAYRIHSRKPRSARRATTTRSARCAAPRTSHQIVGIAISDRGAHTSPSCVEPSSRGASTRMRTRGTLARHQLARVSGKRTCTHQQGGASPIRHGKAEKDGTPPRPSPGAHTACRDLGGLLQGLGLGVELAVVLAGGARVAAEEPAGRRHDTGRRRGAVRPLFCLESFVFLCLGENQDEDQDQGHHNPSIGEFSFGLGTRGGKIKAETRQGTGQQARTSQPPWRPRAPWRRRQASRGRSGCSTP
jgi:hypothetical protein